MTTTPEPAFDPYRPPAEPGAGAPSKRRKGWIAAAVAWTVFSVAAGGFLAAKALEPVAKGFTDGFADGFSAARSRASSATTDPSPSESVAEITMSASPTPLRSVAVTGKDPRPAAAAAWNAANAHYGTGDAAHYCLMYGFGSSYIYNDLKECVTFTTGELAKVSASDRKDVGDTRVKPESMVVLADRSVAFRESDKYWPDHSDWVYDDTSVIVMHLVPRQGWRVVGYVDTTSTSPGVSGYVPAGVPVP